jgi:methionine aminotransferase
MVFDDTEHESIAKNKALAERSLLVSSFGKTVHTTGWKTAYIAAPANLTTEFRKVHQYLVFSCNTPIQMGLADFLKDKETYLELKHFYQQKRDYFAKLLSSTKFSFEISKGTYFQLANYAAISDEKDTDFAIRLTKEFGVASIPLSVFYHQHTDNKLIRFCFAKKEETLENAIEKLTKVN